MQGGEWVFAICVVVWEGSLLGVVVWRNSRCLKGVRAVVLESGNKLGEHRRGKW